MISLEAALFIFAVAKGVHANMHPKSGGNNIDCADKVNHGHAMCICRIKENWNRKICQDLKSQNGGDDIGGLIINGEEVDPNVYPWFARSIIGNSWFGCGGSLVTPEYVLTAAHCVDGFIDDLESNGGYQIGALCAPYGPNSSNNCQQGVQSFGINKIIKHPDYNDNTLQYDFALVRLDGSSTITPVNMDPGNISPGYEDINLKQNLWPAGFGTTENGSVTSRLMHVNVNYIKQSTCDSKYSGGVSDDMMCAADTNQDSCQGDSGGPLYDSDNDVLVGVVSWGIGCALANYPGVYARVSHQISWIKNIICEAGAHNEPRPSFCGSTGPTVSPTPMPPTNAPTQCTGSTYKLSLTTDNYPEETTWNLINKCTDMEIANGGPYESPNTKHEEEGCAPSAEYEFTINDNYGDGICCGPGGSGSYELEYNGEVIKAGGDFGSSESTTFGSCSPPATETPTDQPVTSPVSNPPIDQPTPEPTTPPTKLPTPAPVNSPTPPTRSPQPLTPPPTPGTTGTPLPTNPPAFVPPVVASPLASPVEGPIASPIGDENWIPIGSNDFENKDVGDFVANAVRKIKSNVAYDDSEYSLRIKKKNKIATVKLNIKQYTALKVEFMYYPKNTEVDDHFQLQTKFNGEGWVTHDDFIDLTNEAWEKGSVRIDFENKNNVRIRFASQQNQGNDQIYIDNVEIFGME